MTDVEAFIALGSNVGDREANLRSAIEAIERIPGVEIVSRSGFHDTQPVGPGAQERYLNAAVGVRTSLTAAELLDRLLELERCHGRHRHASVRWGPRTLDLDLLLYGDSIIDQPGLRVPHPRMHERPFVLVPLNEIAPDRKHPVLHRSIADLCDRCGGIGAL